MRVQAYTIVDGVITITVATARAEPMASTKFTAANLHEEYAASARALLREYKHINASTEAFPAAKRLQTYFPTHAGNPLFALLELIPAGTSRSIDDQWQLEIMEIKYGFTLNLLPIAFLADEAIADGVERHVAYAVAQLFEANGVPSVFIPGAQDVRTGNGTDIDITCEVGRASGRRGVDIP
jgi:hypothetical protein